jgi:membrane-associated phospholipid phosphatase
MVLALVLLACALAFVKGGRSAAMLPGVGYPAALLIDLGLRSLVHVPRPGADMVAIAKLADGSGLPSTFALVVGCVLGVVVTVQGHGTPVGKAITWSATALIVTGCGARLVLGGHWLSQIVASLLLAFAFALCLSSGRLAPARAAG